MSPANGGPVLNVQRSTFNTNPRADANLVSNDEYFALRYAALEARIVLYEFTHHRTDITGPNAHADRARPLHENYFEFIYFNYDFLGAFLER